MAGAGHGGDGAGASAHGGHGGHGASGHGGHGDAHRFEHARHWFLFFVAFFISLFIDAFDSFHKATLHHENDAEIGRIVIEPMLNVFFKHQHDYDETARKAITVFVIDDHTQDGGTSDAQKAKMAFDTPYLPYAYQAKYLHEIIRHRPWVVFIDLVYKRKGTGFVPMPSLPDDDKARRDECGKDVDLDSAARDDVSAGYAALLKEIACARADNIRIFTGQTPDDGASRFYFKGLSLLSDQVATEWPKQRHVLDYPFYGYASLTDNRLVDKATAAKAIYDFLCSTPDEKGVRLPLPQPADGSPRPGFRCDYQPGTFPPSAAEPGEEETAAKIMVQWPQYLPTKAPDDRFYNSEPECRHASPDALHGYLRNMSRGLMFNFTEPEKTSPDKCLYIRSFPLYRVFDQTTGKGDDGLLDADVRGKIVMIGDGMTDRFDTPQHGMIPGVFHHAFALQNLLARGRDYIQWPPETTVLELVQDALGFVHLPKPSSLGLFGGLGVPINFFIEWLLTLLEVLAVTELGRVLGWVNGAMTVKIGWSNKVLRRVQWLLRRRGVLRGSGRRWEIAPWPEFKEKSWPYFALALGVFVFFIAYVIDYLMYVHMHWVPINPLMVGMMIFVFNVIIGQDRIFAWWLGLGWKVRSAIVCGALILTVAGLYVLWHVFGR